MDQFRKLFANLSVVQIVTIALVAVAVGAGLFSFANWKREGDFRPLYTALASEDAGAVVQKLKEGAVEYRISEGGTTVLVPSARVAEVRLEMASAGLPKSGRIGFELFDKTNFGATEFVEHINYRRALEGELERTVMSLAEVEQARVHVTFPKESVYLEARQPAKASVVVRVRPGAQLVPQNIIAIEHLVASAVEGLAPDAVSVLDVRGNLLSRLKAAAVGQDGNQPSERLLEIRQGIEKDIVAKISSTLEPLLGAEKFRAGASVECDFSSGEQSEEIFDPSRSVMVSSQKSEDSSGSGSGNSGGGVPGTASNLPRPAPRPATTLASTSRRTESVSYQSSRTVRRVRMPEGTVKKMSLAVLVDQAVRWEGQGKDLRRILEQPSPEKLKSIRDLVAAATGFSTERGDQLIVESLPFESTLNMEAPSNKPAAPKPNANTMTLPPWLTKALDNKLLLVGVSVGVGILLVVVCLALTKGRGRSASASATAALPAGKPGMTEMRGAPSEDHAALQARLDAEALKIAGAQTPKEELLVKRLRESVAKDSALPAHVVRTWINEGA